MRKTMIAVLMGAAAALTACDNFSPPETEDEAVEALPPETVEPAPMPEPEPAPPPTAAPPPTDNTALPPDERTSEESVRPDSDTLFY